MINVLDLFSGTGDKWMHNAIELNLYCDAIEAYCDKLEAQQVQMQADHDKATEGYNKIITDLERQPIPEAGER